MSCGASHTLALSKDGGTIWSFGSGDYGKLGHGEMARLYRPKVIESIQGMSFQKVQAGHWVSLALGQDGQVYAWGSGPCCGHAANDIFSLVPKVIEGLCDTKIVDISLGDNHCLALSQDCTVYAWGFNNMGQCGNGNMNLPICPPQKISALEGVLIHQISAGTSHSMAWTALPSDRSLNPL